MLAMNLMNCECVLIVRHSMDVVFWSEKYHVEGLHCLVVGRLCLKVIQRQICTSRKWKSHKHCRHHQLASLDSGEKISSWASSNYCYGHRPGTLQNIASDHLQIFLNYFAEEQTTSKPYHNWEALWAKSVSPYAVFTRKKWNNRWKDGNTVVKKVINMIFWEIFVTPKARAKDREQSGWNLGCTVHLMILLLWTTGALGHLSARPVSCTDRGGSSSWAGQVPSLVGVGGWCKMTLLTEDFVLTNVIWTWAMYTPLEPIKCGELI